MKSPTKVAHEKNPHCTYQHWQHGAGVPHVMRCEWMADAARAGMIEALTAAGHRLHEIDDCNDKALAMIDELIAEVQKP